MFINFDSVIQFITSILMFPANFQAAFLQFAWGANDPLWLMIAKRAFVLLPVAGFIFSCWITMGCATTLPFRSNRSEFMPALIATWWDYGRAVTQFWGGTFKFVYALIGSSLGLFRLLVLSFLLLVQDLMLSPLRVAKEVGQGYFRPGIPWIAVCITLGWCALEAGVFTFVTTPLVNDVLSAIHDGSISESTMHIVLYCMMFAFVLGSYSILSTWGDAIKKREVSKIVQIGTFEAFVMVFEVLFLYREFVDALVPWFNQYTAGETSIGIVPILAISTFAWLGIRGMTWFLFASAGTPTILAIIQRSGIPGVSNSTNGKPSASLTYIRTAMGSVKNEMEWVQEKGEELLASFILPPLQIIAATINFCTLLITGRHMFKLPFKEMDDLQMQKPVVEQRSNLALLKA
jgi:hypothetical protein